MLVGTYTSTNSNRRTELRAVDAGPASEMDLPSVFVLALARDDDGEWNL